MKLPEKEIELFYKLHWALMYYVNQKTFIIKGLKKPDFTGQELEEVAKLHRQIYSGSRWIDEFADENPFNFSEEEIQIIRSWKNFVKDDFFIIIDRLAKSEEDVWNNNVTGRADTEEKESDEELIRFYASTQTKRLEYENEISAILEKNPSIRNAYMQEVSKSYARGAKKRLVESGVTGWFAILEDMIIASGKTKNEALQRANEMIPDDKIGGIHIFKSGS